MIKTKTTGSQSVCGLALVCHPTVSLLSVSAGAPSLELIPSSAISELSCKVIMFTLGESSQCMVVLMVECCNGPPPVLGEKV